MGAAKIPESPQQQQQSPEEQDLSDRYLDDMGESSPPVTQESKQKALEYKEKATKALASSSDYKKAAKLYGYAICCTNGKSSILFIKRAECLIYMNKPMSARRDCTRAIDLNSDAGKAYLLRAKANIMLNNIEDVHRDLIYVDESQFPTEYDDVKKLYEEKKSIQQSQQSQQQQQQSISSSNMPSWMTPQLFEKVAQDSELVKALQTPKLMNAIQEIATNPNAFLKYKDDPQVITLFMKFSKVMS
jgi:hypothetical protein